MTTTRDFLNVIFRRKWIILGIVALTTVIVFYMKASQPQSFVSSSRILVKRGERSSVFSVRPDYMSWEEEVSSQIEVILSEAVFELARQVFADSLEARGITNLAFNAGSVRADVVGESNVFRISYSSLNPTECVLGCAAVTEAYKRYYRERKAPPAVTEYFSSEIQAALDQLEYWRKQKSDFLSKERYLGLKEEADAQMFKLSRLELAISELSNDVSAARMRADAIQKLTLLSATELEKNLAVGGTRNDLQTGIMQNIKEGLQKLRLEREGLLNKFTVRHPEVVAIDRQIRDLQNELKREVDNAYSVEKARYDELVAQQMNMQQQLANTQSRIDAIPDKEVELSRIENKIESYQARYELLLERQTEAEVTVASRQEWDVSVLQPPSRAWPVRTSDYVRLAVGPFLALIVGLGVAFFFESMDHSLKNASEVEEYLGATVLATFADVGDKVKS